MSDTAVDTGGLLGERRSPRPHLDAKPTRTTVAVFLALLAVVILFALYGTPSHIARLVWLPLAMRM